MKIYANDLNGMKAEIQAELKNHIIPFWEKLKDNDFGGFYGLLDYNLNLDKKAPKGCILNSRILWFFSNAYKLLEDKELALCANHAWNFLNNYCMDKENGGIFCHNNPWVIIGEVVNGRPQDAFEHYKKIAPAYVEEISDIHRTEPYVYSQMVAGKEARREGEAKNSWLTGTAAWHFVALSQYLCGLRPSYEGLVVEPRLPEHVKTAEMTRKFRGVEYIISVKNNKNDGAVKVEVVSGGKANGTTVVADNGAKQVKVSVTVG